MFGPMFNSVTTRRTTGTATMTFGTRFLVSCRVRWIPCKLSSSAHLPRGIVLSFKHSDSGYSATLRTALIWHSKTPSVVTFLWRLTGSRPRPTHSSERQVVSLVFGSMSAHISVLRPWRSSLVVALDDFLGDHVSIRLDLAQAQRMCRVVARSLRRLRHVSLLSLGVAMLEMLLRRCSPR